MEPLFLVVFIWVAAGSICAGWMGRKLLAAAWREPIFRRPVLIVESDDWGAGPLEQAEWLEKIAAVLGSYADGDGRKPVMTLGVVLGVAHGARITAEGLRNYHRMSLADPELAPVLAAIRGGVERGVFALQLHGGEHYWPAALLAAARSDPRIAGWLSDSAIPRTEELPPALQSRWIDASALPSRPLDPEEAGAAATAEAAEFRKLFGREPAVAVPPTFVWNDVVEAAWAQAGVQFVVTPGRRFEARAADGGLVASGPPIANCDCGAALMTYVVRDDYFEPARGHTADRALEGLVRKSALGRPTLFETHRANFLDGARTAQQAIAELDRLLRAALRAFPGLVFLSTEELASRMRRNDPWLIETGFAARLHVWLRRLWQAGRLRRLGYITGAIVPAWLLYTATRSLAPRARSA